MTEEERRKHDAEFVTMEWVATCTHDADGVPAVIGGRIQSLPLDEALEVGGNYFYQDGGLYDLVRDQLAELGWQMDRAQVVDEADDMLVPGLVNILRADRPCYYYLTSHDGIKWQTTTPLV